MRSYIVLYVRNSDRFCKSIEKFKRNDDIFNNGESREIYTLTHVLHNSGHYVYLSNFKDVDIDTLYHRNVYDVNSDSYIDLSIEDLNQRVVAVIPRMLGSIEAQRDNISYFFSNLKRSFSGLVINHPDTVLYALKKNYLKDLVPFGINLPQTDIYDVNITYDYLSNKYNINKHIIKPLTGELSNSVCLLRDIDQTFLNRKREKVGGWIIQPYYKTIWNGERQYLFINGELIYGYMKAYVDTDADDKKKDKLPKLHNIKFIQEFEVRSNDVDLCHKTLNVLNNKLGYITYICRFDIIDDLNGEPMIMECEMINPSFRSWYLTAISKKIVELIHATMAFSDFDCGAIIHNHYDSGVLHVSLKKTDANEINHWFYFGVRNSPSSLKIVFDNAMCSRFASGWERYRPFISFDNKIWKRCDEYFIVDDNNSIHIDLLDIPSVFYIAWYPPYSVQQFIEYVKHEDEIYQIGNTNGYSILITARQHPGETMSSFFIEGLIDYLHSEEAAVLLSQYNFIIIPFVNALGVSSGMHRTSLSGVDYNFCWFGNDIQEVVKIKKFINNKRLLLYFDIHGDEVSKMNYIYYTSKYRKRNSLLLDKISHINSLRLLCRNRLKYILKVLYKKHKLILGVRNTVDYIEQNKKCPGYVYEISAHITTPEECKCQGRNFGVVLNDYLGHIDNLIFGQHKK